MNKSLFVIAGIALLAVPSLHAQGRGRGAGAAPRGGAFANAPAARASAFNRNSAFSRNSSFNRGRYRGGYHHGGHRGRYYYLGGVPYFYPFFDYGFGYPGYYGAGFGYGYTSSFYDDFGGPGPGYYDAPYDGRIVDETTPANLAANGTSLQTAVQRQLARKGYYKGAIDGDFGEGSREALRHYQKDRKLKDTGRLDEATLKALGFTDRR